MIKTLLTNVAVEWIKERHPIIVDARDAAAYRKGHLPNALPLSLSTVTSVIRKLRRQRPVLVYGHGSETSRDFADLFIELGFEDVYRLEGGFEAWSAIGAEIERPPALHADVRCDPLTGWLMDQGGDPDDVNAALPDGTPPLIQACRLRRPDMCSALIAAGARLSATDLEGNDALSAACGAGDFATLRVLFEAGVSINRRNAAGMTVLAWAALAGKPEMVAFLLAAGADPLIRTRDNRTAVDLAANLEVSRMLAQPTRAGAMVKMR